MNGSIDVVGIYLRISAAGYPFFMGMPAENTKIAALHRNQRQKRSFPMVQPLLTERKIPKLVKYTPFPILLIFRSNLESFLILPN